MVDACSLDICWAFFSRSFHTAPPPHPCRSARPSCQSRRTSPAGARGSFRRPHQPGLQQAEARRRRRRQHHLRQHHLRRGGRHLQAQGGRVLQHRLLHVAEVEELDGDADLEGVGEPGVGPGGGHSFSAPSFSMAIQLTEFCNVQNTLITAGTNGPARHTPQSVASDEICVNFRRQDVLLGVLLLPLVPDRQLAIAIVRLTHLQ